MNRKQEHEVGTEHAGKFYTYTVIDGAPWVFVHTRVHGGVGSGDEETVLFRESKMRW